MFAFRLENKPLNYSYMKSTKYLILFIFALALTASSCKKDEETLSKKEMLTAKSWNLQSSTTNGVAVVSTDCEKDDILTFSTNGTYSIDPGVKKCTEIDKIESGPWSLSADEKYITIDEDEIITILEITNTRLVILQIVGANTYETILVAI